MKKLMEKRAELIAELETLTNAAESGEEVRSYTDEERTRMDEIGTEIENIDKTIEIKEKAMAALSAKQPEVRSADDEHAMINRFARNPMTEIRSDETAIGNNTGVKFSQFSQDIIHGALELAGIANLVNTVEAYGTYKQIVSNPSYKIAGAFTAEAVAPTVSEARWTTVSIDTYKYVSEAVVTYEMLNQAAFDVVPELLTQFTLDFAYALENSIINGTGDTNGQPTGLTAGGTSFTLPATGVITAANIVDIYHSLKSYYTQNAVWVMNNQTLSKIRQLADSAGQYIFKQSEDFNSGFAGTILGKPVLVSETMPDLKANTSTTATGGSPILYGDFARGYKAVRTPDVQLQVLNEKYAGVGRGILGILWLGGKPVNSEAYTNVIIDTAT